jgi:hypothetical protein
MFLRGVATVQQVQWVCPGGDWVSNSLEGGAWCLMRAWRWAQPHSFAFKADPKLSMSKELLGNPSWLPT